MSGNTDATASLKENSPRSDSGSANNWSRNGPGEGRVTSAHSPCTGASLVGAWPAESLWVIVESVLLR